jgi:hypothetical protein
VLAVVFVAGAVAFADGAAKPSALTKKKVVKLIKKEIAKHPGPQGPQGQQGPPGNSAQKIVCKTNTGVPATGCGTVFNSDGLKVDVNCANNGFTARATQQHAVMTVSGSEPAGFFFDSIQDSAINSGFILNPAGGDAAAQGTVLFTPFNSDVVIRLDYSATVVSGAPQGDCVFIGTISKP